MRYLSTRSTQASNGEQVRKKFCDILLEGLAPDGGLYLPENYPQINTEKLTQWRSLSYADLAYEIFSLYIDDIPSNDLKKICHKTYSKEIFGSEIVVPLKKLDDTLYIEELSHGPTSAFKDIALQLLGNLFEYELARRNKYLNILGATSGDTGSAAEYAMRGKCGIRVFMMSPDGRMSPFQQAQMYSLQDPNIYNIAIQGVFDDCQDIVKTVSGDQEFKNKFSIGTVNSINWARLMAQVVYYFSGYFAATRSNEERVSFAVPSGNFGNVCAGHIARMMGLPIDKLVVATNENDVLDEFFKTGVYRVRTSEATFETSSPSMDISKASNFERFIFDLLGRDASKVNELFIQQLANNGKFCLSNDERFLNCESLYGFTSGKSTHTDRITTIQKAWQNHQILIDPHTADALKIANEKRTLSTPMLVLETALPVKFSSTIKEALNFEPPKSKEALAIENLPKRVRMMKADAQLIKDFMMKECQASSNLN